MTTVLERTVNSKFPTPRVFQVTTREKLKQGFIAGHKNQLVMAPTGSGKTILSMFLINEGLQKGKRVLFIADRKTLINQTSATADSVGLLNHGVIMSQHWRFNMALPFQIASAQTLARRGIPDDFDLVIIDEAHTQLKVWTDFVANCKAAVIGLSATPFAKGMDKHFSNVVNAATMRELTDLGILVPLRVMSCTRVNMVGAETAGGEWTDMAAQQRGMEIVGDVIAEWLKLAENRKTIVFGATISHCEEMCKEFNNAGVMAAVFTADTTEAERKELLAEFKKPDSFLRVLISVEALAKGFDQPDVACICDVRPLRKSLSTAIQMWGRGLRSAPGTDKHDLLLLDFSGNIVRFAADFEEIFHNGLDQLDDGEKLDKEIRKEKPEDDKEGCACPQCQHKPFVKRCISCGFEIVKKSLIEHEVGEMVEFKVGKATIGDKLAVWEQCVTLCKTQGKFETAKGRAAHLYKSITGVFPRNMPEFDMVQAVPVSRGIMNKQRANMIAHRSVAKS